MVFHSFSMSNGVIGVAIVDSRPLLACHNGPGGVLVCGEGSRGTKDRLAWTFCLARFMDGRMTMVYQELGFYAVPA
jgi:hypothetical protein